MVGDRQALSKLTPQPCVGTEGRPAPATSTAANHSSATTSAECDVGMSISPRDAPGLHFQQIRAASIMSVTVRLQLRLERLWLSKLEPTQLLKRDKLCPWIIIENKKKVKMF